MSGFLEGWSTATRTTLGFFWMALWAFALGYVISSAIQVFVTRERMQRAMGQAGTKSVGLATFFGFISSSCSFAALATTKALFKKGAGLIPALAFMLASTNLVIELGIVIAVFLSWHFVVGEYVGGILLIVIMWIFVKTTRPSKMIEHVRERMREEEDEDGGEQEPPDWREMIRSKEGWGAVGKRYAMEWGMVWKDVTVGFTIAGVIAAFVPRTFFEWLFIGTGEGESLTFLHVLEHVLVGPVAAFMTFIGSMGNIPLAGVLYGHGVSVAGIMAFIFSDLVVFPVLRINAKYYGWKMAVYILLTLLVALVGAALIIHYGFAVSGLQPEAAGGKQVTEQDFFAVDYTLFLNIGFLAVSGILVWLGRSEGGLTAGMMSMSKGVIDRVLFYLSIAAYAWIAGGLLVLLIER